MAKKTAYLILMRYSILLLITLVFYFFHKLLFFITIHSAYLILKLIYNQSFVFNDLIVIGNNAIRIVNACVAPSAYLLLIILNLSSQINLKKRILVFLFSQLTLFAINIIRIILFSILFVNNIRYFEVIHSITWNIFSTLIVVLIWFFCVKTFRIKSIPIYSDLTYLYALIKKK